MKLITYHPQHLTEGRTQSYRCIVQLVDDNPSTETRWFVCTRRNNIIYFERVARRHELSSIPTVLNDNEFRTDRLDIYVPSQHYIDAFIAALLNDIKEALNEQPFVSPVHLSGATI